jgi:hypothetical protein
VEGVGLEVVGALPGFDEAVVRLIFEGWRRRSRICMA